MKAIAGLELRPWFSDEENLGFPSEDKELFVLIRHYFSLRLQYFY